MTGPVVVGLDGSPASETAAWWAAREASDRHLPLVLLHSWTTQPLDVPIAQEAHNKQRYGREILERASAELLHRHGDLDLTTELVSAPAADALLERGESASMLVLGSRGHGSVASFLLGTISLHVLGLTPCPAVAVRAGDPAVEAGWGHPAAADRDEVVVGVQEPGA
ncbi:universal stress protein, partial [Streptomyces sp. T21Q-yed]